MGLGSSGWLVFRSGGSADSLWGYLIPAHYYDFCSEKFPNFFRIFQPGMDGEAVGLGLDKFAFSRSFAAFAVACCNATSRFPKEAAPL